MVQIVDGLGQVGSRVWPSVGSLPAPRLGAFVTVDDGTTGTVYFGCSVGGVAQWVPLPSLLDVIHTVATPTNNQITSSDPTATGLGISTSGPALSAQSPVVAGLFSQPDGSAGVPAVQVHRAAGTPGTALIEVEFATLEGGALVNGSGETCVSFYSALPAASVYHRGAIIRVSPGAPTADTFYLGGLDASGADVWLNFTGAQGPPGVTPIFQIAGGYIQVSYDSGATWTDLVALSAITGPAGPQGPPGLLNFPPLPSVGGSAVTFWTPIFPDGTPLPWLIPSGYTVQVVGGWDLWGYFEATNPLFLSDYLGNANISPFASQVDTRYPAGKILSQTYTPAGANYAYDGSHVYNDATVALLLSEDTYVLLLENLPVSVPYIGYVWAQIEVTPAPASGCHDWNFLSSDGGWVTVYTAGGSGQWISGSGWQSQLINATQAYLETVIAVPSDFTLTRFILSGTAYAPNVYIVGYATRDPSTYDFLLGPYALDSSGALDVSGLSQAVLAGHYIGLYIGPGGIVDISAATFYMEPNPYGDNCS